MLRRELVLSAIAAGLGSPRWSGAAEAPAPAPYADPAAADQWIRAVLEAPRAVAGPLTMGRFVDRMYFLLDTIGWTPGDKQAHFATVDVPRGFVTDMASIPRAFWSLLPPDGNYAYAAILHDYLYWFQTRPREECDQILKYAMEDTRVSSDTVAAIYAGVRLGGGSAWAENAAARKAGERRVLAQFPKDPRITWAVWKTRPGVFAT